MQFLFHKMVQAITVLTVLKMLTNAQTSCNQGLGRVMYERLPDQQLQGFDDDVVRDTAPPFRVLEQCQELCLRDRTATNNLVRACTSFDFQPGSRIASFSGTVEYEESTCYLTREQAHPEGIGNLVLVPNSVHYTEVCLSSSRIERECPSRHYVFERHARKKLKLAVSDIKEVIAANRTDCEDRCLNEFNFVCRSATYDATARTCWLSRYTRRSHPQLLEDDPNSDYLENTCLNADRRCDGPIIFVKEENKRLGGPFEVDIYTNLTLVECQAQCLRAEKYFCRSIEYDEQIRRCIIFEEDSLSQKDDLRISSSPTHDLYDLVCLDSPKGSEFSDNSGTSHLFADGRRPDTAFQRYRNSRLGGEFHSEITGRSLSECLDECLRQASFQCRSAVYSDRFRICRLSRFNQRDGHRIIYDADYDYYENLMNYYLEGDVAGSAPHYRPDPLGQDTSYHGQGRPHLPPGGHYGGGNAIGGLGSGGAFYPGTAGGHFPIPGEPPGYWGPLPGHPPPPDHPYGGPGSAFAGNNLIGAGSAAGPGSGPFFGPHLPGDGKPFISRCDESDTFKQVGIRLRARRQFVRRFLSVPSLSICEKACMETHEFICRSFNFKASPAAAFTPQKENCELSDHDTRDLNLNNPSFFETTGDYDFYERSPGRSNLADCLDVNQVCSEDGMEFTLRTPEPFIGRIYTYGYYDRCFYRGNGGTANVLRISGAQGYPDCGTQRYGDVMTNIVVVQFSDFVQTGRDKRYNLTCLLRGPGEAVVTSSYMTANSGSPIPIEYLPAENSLSSRVRLLILFQGRPTNTIAVGDPLTFRLEAQDGYNYATDIFATNVIARDPYSGRSVQLIDRFGCPVDNYVFPGLDRSREGDGLEARFNAFKIPESNFLVFEATVRTCREGCTPAYCTGHSGKSEPSLGRKRRETQDNEKSTVQEFPKSVLPPLNESESTNEEHVREMIEVFESRYEMPQQQRVETIDGSVCLTNREYYSLILALSLLFVLIVFIILYGTISYRRNWKVIKKNIVTDQASHKFSDRNTNAFSVFMPSTSSKSFLSARTPKCMIDTPKSIASFHQNPNVRHFEDPSEPIYTDPSLFERSRSLRSIAVLQEENLSKDV
ncbi:no mechanoreceptor potential A isoform X2 [Rhodnius prolixus]|uniref:no mechanoreceptor potential A isoform X2 n=1 Tax=Rhodnius prolixus TaxID=13249 RepID=UPI003D18AEE5